MENIEGFFGGAEIKVGFAFDHHIKTALYDIPIVFVAIGDADHATAAGSDFDVGAVELAGEVFETLDVIFGAVRIDVATIEDSMDTDATDAIVIGFGNHLLEMSDVAVDATVGKNASEMKCATV